MNRLPKEDAFKIRTHFYVFCRAFGHFELDKTGVPIGIKVHVNVLVDAYIEAHPENARNFIIALMDADSFQFASQRKPFAEDN